MGPEGATVAETHSGIVFLVGDRAYKLKKPVDLGFLDFRSRETREAVCHREVELNRRLAPDVYLGVADVNDVDGNVCDHLIVMRRMPADRRLSTLVTSGVDVSADMRKLAHLIATFHAGAAALPAAGRVATAAALGGRWTANVCSMLQFVGSVLDADVAHATAELARRYLDGRGELFDRRIADGRARDGHGDLLADDIFCLDDGPRVLDCLEFDDLLRYGDVLADVAFLAMDLERLGRADLAASFLADYQELSGDHWPASLAHHHIAYRAHVRAKVACLRSAQGDPAAQGQAALLLGLAHRHLDAGRVRLVLIGGLPGTGKSTLAAGLGDALGAVVLRSDEVRKELLGIPATEHAVASWRQGPYRPETTWATYDTLLARARTLLAGGESVVLDASWLDPVWRHQAELLAVTATADLSQFRCVLAGPEAATRLQRRMATGSDPSDATPSIAAAMAAVEAPWPAAIDVDTSPSPERVTAAALGLLREADRRP